MEDLVGIGRTAEGFAKLAYTAARGIGKLAEPWLIVRRAKAERKALAEIAEGEAESEKIKALARVDTSMDVGQKVLKSVADIAQSHGMPSDQAEFMKRTLFRSLYGEMRKQKNIEQIIGQAALMIPERISDQPVDEDWISSFFEQCANVSDEDMQSLWAKLLAGEVAAPGSFSPRTLAFVKTMTKQDADLFTRYCSFLWLEKTEKLPYRFPTVHADPIFKKTMPFMALLHLESIGLMERELQIKLEKIGRTGSAMLIHAIFSHFL